MKKSMTLLLAAVLSVTLCACGHQADGTADSSAEQTSVVSTAVSKEPSVDKQPSDESSGEKSKASSATESHPVSSAEPSEDVSEDTSAEESSEESSQTVSQDSEASEDSEVSEVSEVSEEPSEEPSPEPSEESSEEEPESSEQEESSRIQPAPQPPVSGETVDASWFDDAVFVGDSVTLKLSYYADYGSLGNADFLCAGSLGYNNAQWDYDHPDNVHPVYNGVKYTVEDGVAMLQPKKIFIMLGMNDIGMYGVDGAVEGMKSLTAKIAAQCPSAVIYVQSVTPMLQDMQPTDLNNTTIAAFDAAIQPICQERGYRYLDIASAVGDGYGNLLYEYCGDPTAMGLHFSDAGCEVWVNYLKSHVA